MGPPFEKENPGISDAYLEGNIGTSQEIQSSVVPPAPPLVQSDPNGVVVAQASVVGGDPIGVPLTVNIRISVPAAALTAGESLKATIEWGSGGFQPAAADFDVRQSQVITVHGSWVRVKVVNNASVAINMAAFVTIGTRQGNTDPVTTEIITSLLAATSIDFPIPSFAKYVQVFSQAPAADNYNVAFRVGAVTIYAVQIAPGVNGTEKIPTTSAADTVRVSNIGAATINRAIVFFGMQL